MTETYVEVCAVRRGQPSSVCLLFPSLVFFNQQMLKPKWLRYVYLSIYGRRKNRRLLAVAEKMFLYKAENWGQAENTYMGPTILLLGKIKILPGCVLAQQQKHNSAAIYNNDYAYHWPSPCERENPTPPLFGIYASNCLVGRYGEITHWTVHLCFTIHRSSFKLVPVLPITHSVRMLTCVTTAVVLFLIIHARLPKLCDTSCYRTAQT